MDVSDPDEDPAVSDPAADDVLAPAVLFVTRGAVDDEELLHAASAPASASTRPRREDCMTGSPGEKIAWEMSLIYVQMVSIRHVTSCPLPDYAELGSTLLLQVWVRRPAALEPQLNPKLEEPQ